MTEQKTQEKLNEETLSDYNKEIIHKIQIEEKFELLNDPEIKKRILSYPEMFNICLNDYYIIKTIANDKCFFQELITKKATTATKIKTTIAEEIKAKKIISQETINTFKTKAIKLKDNTMINFLNQAEMYNSIIANRSANYSRTRNFLQIIFNNEIPNDQKDDIINILDNNRLDHTSKRHLMTIINMNEITAEQKINLINLIESYKIITVEQKTDLLSIIDSTLITAEQKPNLINIIKSNEITDERKTILLSIIKDKGLNIKQKGGLITQVNNDRLKLEEEYSLMPQEQQAKLVELRKKQGSLKKAITEIELENSKIKYK